MGASPFPTSEKQLFLAAPRGFCAGVRRAVETAYAALAKYGAPLYCLNEIVHNRQIVAEFAACGIRFVRDIGEVPDGATILFSAHGVPPQTRKTAAAKNLHVIDATCPFVNKVHQEARLFAERGYTIFLLGKHGHDEVLGVAGEAPTHIVVIESEAEAQAAPDRQTPVAVLTQTTLSAEDTAQLKKTLLARFPHAEFPPKDDICYATRNRQEAVRQLARFAKTIFVLGSSNSSNSQRLVEVAQNAGSKALLIPDLAALQNFDAYPTRLGLTAGASVPEDFIKNAIDYLKTHGYNYTREIRVAEESIQFPPPPGLQ